MNYDAKLTDYILVDILADRLKHTRKDEYPIHSDKQDNRKKGKYNHVQYIEYVGDDSESFEDEVENIKTFEYLEYCTDLVYLDKSVGF